MTKSGHADGMREPLRLLGNDVSAQWEVKLAGLRTKVDGTETIWSKKACDTRDLERHWSPGGVHPS